MMKNTSEGVLELQLTLEIMPSYLELKKLCELRKVTHSDLFIPQSLSYMDSAFISSPELLQESIGFLDAVCYISHLINRHSGLTVECIKDLIVSNRTVLSTKNTLTENRLDDYLYSSPEELKVFLDSNPHLMGVYIYLMLYKMGSGSEESQ